MLIRSGLATQRRECHRMLGNVAQSNHTNTAMIVLLGQDGNAA